jgi:hypothetical protein
MSSSKLIQKKLSKPLSLSKHLSAKNSIKINGAFFNVGTLLEQDPVLLWNEITTPTRYKRKVLAPPVFLRLKGIIQQKYPEVFQRSLDQYNLAKRTKRLKRDIANGDLKNNSSSFKSLN